MHLVGVDRQRVHVGEALLIVWLFKLAIKGTRASESQHPVEMPVRASEALES